MVMVPNTMKNVPYEVTKDFAAVGILSALPLALCVSAASPVKDIKGLVELVKALQGAASYASFGAGSSAHLMMELLVKQAGLKMIHVPYKGVAAGLQDLVGGQVTTAVSDPGTAGPLAKAGRIRSIALASARRSRLMPDLPTFAEQGVTGMEVFAP